ncbi:hypothetical protein GQ44DRAFT_782051 [Phaeosphaeriaceae sp. PMI808]|nr:hypothetical protein GQ44DRAFT_782051 [Phaeosphaeriaceae sp. PMI808]
MPIKWSAELDAILIRGVFEEYNVSFTRKLTDKLAARIQATGIECTYKAVEGRLYGWKKKNTAAANAVTASVSTPAKKAAATPKKPSAPRSNKTSTKKRPASTDTDSETIESPSTGRGKRARTMPASLAVESETSDEGSEYVPFAQRLKMEVKDEEGGFEVQGEEGEFMV